MTSLIEAHVINTETPLVQSMSIEEDPWRPEDSTNKYLLSINLVSHKYYDGNVRFWWSGENFYELMEKVFDSWRKGYNIYFIASDSKGQKFAYFALTNLGSHQKILSADEHGKRSHFWSNNFKITGLFVRGKDIMLVMTKGMMGYGNKRSQGLCFVKTWKDAQDVIDRWKNERRPMILTSICYSSSIQEYVLVGTESSKHQILYWRATDLHSSCYNSTLLFTDPVTHKNLIVMTENKYGDIRGCSVLERYPVV